MTKPKVSPDHSIHPLISNRWSPRAFDGQSLSHDQMNQLFEAMRWAPSSFNEQPWKVIYAIRSEKENFNKVLSTLVEWNQNWAKTAGALMITVAKDNFDLDGSENKHAWHDIGLAIGNLSFQATHMGIYLHQMGGIEREQIKSTFEIPDGYTPVTGIALGHPGDILQIPEEIQDDEMKAQERKKVNSFAFNAEFK